MFESNHFTIRLQTGPDEDAYLPPEKVQKLLKRASGFRGDVINQLVFIDDKLRQYLDRYFCDNPKKRDELRSMTFNRIARVFRAIVAKKNVPNPADDLIYLGQFRDSLAHGMLIYEPRTRQLKIHNQKTGDLEALSTALRTEIDEKVIRVDEFLNGLLAKQ
jgi:hypothetical protein